ncbi:MAG: calcineurin-like phosphoesterase C-terminal domain-containing protein [Bacteroidales bacterium]|nr:calcineurin-like phosphoesterase C-terminal domain-containing protein [Bacteroidales bacterium]
MKRKLLFIALGLACLISCKKEPVFIPKEIEKTDTTTVDPVDDPNSIAGVSILEENNAVGMVTDASTGKGIAGVPVTDGYSWTRTDEKGVYQFKLDGRARLVYITVPADYEIPLDVNAHVPAFYAGGLDLHKRNRNDFSLQPLGAPETEFSLIMLGDPQCQNDSHLSRYTDETMTDLRSYVSSYPRPYAVTLGDIVWNATGLWPKMRQAMSNVEVSGRYVPFFQCIGNHDHTATAALESKYDDTESLAFSTADREADYLSTTDFVETFGPTDYSFDRGSAHIVVMDDVGCYGITRKKKLPDGYTCDYTGGLSDEQLAWLREDLSMVPDKENKLVVFCCHIPFRLSSGADGYKNFQNVLILLSEFHEAHIMDAHTHYSQNHIHTNYVCKGGKPIYEHVHGAACGAFWQSNSSKTGSPNGYNVYRVCGNSIASWICKGARRDEGYQMRIYDGNRPWGEESGLVNNYILRWYTVNNSVGTGPDTAKGYASFKDSFVAEVWDDDWANWSLEFWQDGVKKGDFIRTPEKACCNIAITSFYYNKIGLDSDAYCSKVGTHYWYYKPSSGLPSSEKNWEVRATVTYPFSGEQRTFTCSRLTNDYSEY